MQQNSKVNYINSLTSFILGSAFLAIMFFISAFTIYKGNLPEKFYIPFMLISVILSGFCTGHLSAKKTRKNGLIKGAITVLPISVLLLIAMSAANSNFEVVMIIPCLLMIISGAAGGIVAVNTSHKIKKK